eukprot:TRINITY_DN16363_c0_g1_i1.p1 TRINITY_DN16363_c0_g1~~TRINITY_DN16363_c0_g1_i1.p1  ORF type:complete len:461 (+),score=39.72 TRINITY_DN16363_c0_g1_i1:1195-2577(+)
MEGSAGVACFLADLMQPEFAHFPGWETSTAPPATEIFVPRSVNPFTPDNGECLTRGVWRVPVLTTESCKKLTALVWSVADPERRSKDAIRLGAPFTRFVNSFAAFAEQFVRRVMLPTDPQRCTLPKPVSAPLPMLVDFAPLRAAIMEGKDIATLMDCDQTPATPREAETAAVTHIPLLTVWRAYVIRYDNKNHPSIQSHTDASDITFNLCLVKTCKSGDLYFDASRTRYTHTAGEATIFWGDTVHHTHNVTGNGERVQLVLLLNFARPQSNQPRGCLPFTTFPYPVQLLVCSFCPPQTLASLMYSSRHLCQLANEGEVWRTLYANNSTLTSFVPVNTLTGETAEAPSEAAPPKPLARLLIPRSPIPRLRLDEAEKFRKQVVLVGDDWKNAYRQCLTSAAMWAEHQRRETEARHQMLWRAIIGIYPVHNMRRSQRIGRPESNSIEESEDGDSGCEECKRFT